MRHIFALYPGGAAGAGLLILRLHAVLLLVDLAIMQSSQLALATIVLMAVVALGLLARVAAALSLAALAASAFVGAHLPPIQSASHACGLIALVLLGPGAFSIDARRFGRKVIRLP